MNDPGRPKKSRIRSSGIPRPKQVRDSPAGFLREHLIAAHEKLRRFSVSVHPDDHNIGRIFKTLSFETNDDFVALVFALREPGSPQAPNRPAGSSRYTEEDNRLLAVLKQLGRPLTRADCRQIVEARGKPVGNSVAADVNRLWSKAKALGLTENSG